eukprot:TRINITY_DN5755_c0_g1_i5.p1 TRINITY_DN5755_c0_g1~~TRINITY_DN5755_c0_g1_i5.p1  ORF type:complete len:454 (-),score=85.16 TRINITY_DN5755_c0_g1_i5:583-1803(-)
MVKDRRPKKNGKTLNVAVLGIPNSGKSTLINRLIGKEVCAYSCKKNTTRKSSRAILNDDDTQIVFLDTPGVVNEKEVKRFKLEESLSRDPEMSCREAHLLLVMQDCSNRFSRESIGPKVLRLLCKYQHRVPMVLVLNKMDVMPQKRYTYDLIRKLTCNTLIDGVGGDIKLSSQDPKWNVESYVKRLQKSMKYEENSEGKDEKDYKKMTYQKILTECRQGPVKDDRANELIKGMIGWPGFSDVFCISAKTGSGLQDLKSYIIDSAKPGGHRFHPSLIHDQDPKEAVINIVKSKLLDNLEREVPFELQPKIQYWTCPDGKCLEIGVLIEVKRARHARKLIGMQGKTINYLANIIEASLIDYFDADVKLILSATLPQSEENKMSLNAIRLENRALNSERHRRENDPYLV